MKIVRFFLFISFCLYLLGCGDAETHRSELTKLLITGDSDVEVTGIPPKLTEMYKAHYYADECLAYYTKYIDAGGIAIVGNRYVRDEQFYVAREVILLMTSKRPELRQPLSLNNVDYGFEDRVCRVILINREEPRDSEFSSEYGRRIGAWTIPEAPNFFPGLGWATYDLFPNDPDGYSALPNYYIVVTTGWKWKLYDVERIDFSVGVLVHEFAHALDNISLRQLDPTFGKRLSDAYQAGCILPETTNTNRFKNAYGCRSRGEYWAEHVKDWHRYTPQYLEKWLFNPVLYPDDQLVLPLLEEWLPKTYLSPLRGLGQPIAWEWGDVID